MSWSKEKSQGNEAIKIRNRVATYLCGKGLDLGCGSWKVIPSRSMENYCIGVDLDHAEIKCDLGNLALFKDEYFDYVFSSHALEDFFYTEGVLKEWWRLIKPSGYLILYLPLTKLAAKQMGLENWESFYPNIGEPFGNENHKVDFIPSDIDDLMGKIGYAKLVDEEIRGDADEYSFLKVYQKMASIKLDVQMLEKRPPQKRACIVRYGAIGDMIQASPVFRLIKEQGYHVTVNCTPMGEPLLRNNPNVDEVAIQIGDVVPNPELKSYWEQLEKKYDLFINLSGSAEESCLIPDSKLYLCMEELKAKVPESTEIDRFAAVIRNFRKLVGHKNYYDNHLEKAGLSERGLNGELYFSEGEELVAHDFRTRHKNDFLIEWSLSGSAYHKIYPYFQHAVQMILHPESPYYIPEALVISVGDYICSMMERAESDRYLPRAEGSSANVSWPLRMSLVMTKYVDLVVGAETGILNAAGCFDTPKITMLSHSSHENLCKYWKNDFCIAPEEKIWCHPCHVLHYNHPRGKGTFCNSCHTTHEPQDERPLEMAWTCPYETEFDESFARPDDLALAINNPKEDEAQVYPFCTARGIHPERLVKRIHEVYAIWKAKREAKELTQVIT